MSTTFCLNTGSLMPKIAVGTFKIRGYDVVYSTLKAALKAGYRSIDTAQVYRNENDIGQALKELLPKYGLTREDVFITSKVGPANHGSRCLDSCLESIQKLGLDHLDLMLIHWPGKAGLKPEDPEHPSFRLESWRALETLFKQGKLKAIGVSNYTVGHMTELLGECHVKPALLQVEHHPYLVQADLHKLCTQHGIVYQAYSSLGSMGNMKLLQDPVIMDIADEYEKTAAQILLRWALQHDIGVIPKSTNITHIAENVALVDWELKALDMCRIDNLDKQDHFCWDPSTIR